MSIAQSNIAIGVNANGGLQIFARGVTGTIYTAAQPNAGGSFSGSGHWISPAVTPGGSCHSILVGSPAAPEFFQ